MNIEKDIADAYGVESFNLLETSTEIPTESVKKISDIDRLTLEIKEKLSISDYKSKIQLLTLTPESGSRKYAAEYFNVSEYLIRTARKLKEQNGILSIPSSKKGSTLSNDTVMLVKHYYEDERFSRQMPGKKDYVSVARNQHRQKRLLLVNLHELYVAFKKDYRNEKIGFSKFCSLRPKWCIIVGSSGTHSVCVCTYHQNAKLLVSAIKWQKKYKALMNIIVCNVDDRECMVHRCSNCPGTKALRLFLKKELEGMDPEEEFYFNQWQSTDRTSLITRCVTTEEYKDLLIEVIDKLTVHSFIAKCQGEYLKQCKDNLLHDECIWLGDFSENYEFVVQDEVQSYHWNKEQCTLHPIVLYHKDEENKLNEKSFCFISDDREHDTCFVYVTQQHINAFLQNEIPHITKIKYFSDGCGGQYKNYKKKINLCHHKGF